jgi:hypothetical protein
MPADIADEDTAYLRQLMAEARAMKTKPLPGTISLIAGHPGVIANEIDSPAEWAADQRQQYVLSRLAERYERPVASLPAHLAAAVGEYKRGELKDIDSPYHYRGWFTSGAPLHNVATAFQTLGSGAYAASALAANAVDPAAPFDPDAKKKFDTALNTLTAYGAEAAGLVPRGTPTFASVAEDARYQRGAMGGMDALPEQRAVWNAMVGQAHTNKTNDLYGTGDKHFQRAGMSETPAAFAGAFTDSVLDPWNGLGRAAKMARAGMKVKALKEVVGEFGFPMGTAAASAYGMPTR